MKTPARAAVIVVVALAFLSWPASRSASAQFAWFPDVVDQADLVGTHTSLAFDVQGRPHIAYLDASAATVKHAVRDGAVWRVEIVDRIPYGTGPTSLALDASGEPHISYFDGVHLRYASYDGSRWNVSIVDRAHDEGTNSLAIGRDGFPRIAYAWDTGVLRFAQWDGQGWVTTTVETETLVARYVSLVLDPIDSPHISYTGNGNLRYASWIGTRWTVDVADSTADTGWFNRLALDDRGWPRIAYYDSGLGELRFASWDGITRAWTHEVVDSDGDAGWDIGFALDTNGGAHVSYYARLASELRYAEKIAAQWESQVVDSFGVVGWYTSLALNATGSPSIAYYDWSDGALKFASSRIEFQVRTLSADAVGLDDATLRGELACLGPFAQANVSFEWRAAGSGTWNRTAPFRASAPTTFRQQLGNLSPATAYEFRMVGDANGSIVYGDLVTFETATVPPIQPSFVWLAAVVVGSDLVGALLIAGFLWWRRGFRRVGSGSEVARDEVPRP